MQSVDNFNRGFRQGCFSALMLPYSFAENMKEWNLFQERQNRNQHFGTNISTLFVGTQLSGSTTHFQQLKLRQHAIDREPSKFFQQQLWNQCVYDLRAIYVELLENMGYGNALCDEPDVNFLTVCPTPLKFEFVDFEDGEEDDMEEKKGEEDLENGCDIASFSVPLNRMQACFVIKQLWMREECQGVWESKMRNLQLSHSTAYFISRIEELSDPHSTFPLHSIPKLHCRTVGTFRHTVFSTNVAQNGLPNGVTVNVFNYYLHSLSQLIIDFVM